MLRFVQRAQIPPRSQLVIKSAYEFPITDKYKWLTQLPPHPLNRKYQMLELYYPLKGKEFPFQGKPHFIVNGFSSNKITGYYGNGIYLYNEPIQPFSPSEGGVMIYHVPTYLPKIRRHPSIFTKHGSIYVVTSEGMVIPRYFIDYRICPPFQRRPITFYDRPKSPQFPTILKEDLVSDSN